MNRLIATLVVVAVLATAAFGLLAYAINIAMPVHVDAQNVFVAGRVTVATTATPIFTTPARGGEVRICNRHTTPIFIGAADVTTANGFEVLNATCENIRPYPRAVVYGIVAAATARVDFFVHEYQR